MMDWLDLLAVQGTLKSLLQSHSSKASILQLSLWSSSHNHRYHWEDHSLDYMDVFSTVMSAFQHTAQVCLAFLPRSKRLLISCLQSPSAVILEPKKKISVNTSTFLSSICHEVMGTVKKAEHQRIDAFELWCWRRLLRVPLDFKEIQPVHPKGDQSWVFIGRTDAEAETPILWPPHVKS